jgi:hypothetical protein
LIKHAISTSRKIGCSKLLVFSDPHAKGFYLKMGAGFIQDCPSSIEGRTIPMMEFEIGDQGRIAGENGGIIPTW